MIPACLSLMCSFNRGNIEGTNSSKICVWCLCVYVLCLRRDWFCGLTWQRVEKGEKSLEMYICLWPEFDCPEVTLCGWQDIKIQLLLLLLLQNWLNLLQLYPDMLVTLLWRTDRHWKQEGFLIGNCNPSRCFSPFQFFDDAPIFRIPGRRFPVDIYYTKVGYHTEGFFARADLLLSFMLHSFPLKKSLSSNSLIPK